MSAINITNQIPNSIVTVEQMALWLGFMMKTIYPNQQVLETEVGAVDVVQTGIFKAADGTTRAFIRFSIELDESYLTDRNSKIWMKAQEFAQVSIPASYTTN